MHKLGPILLALGIVLGALGAHAFAPHLEASALESYKTGVLYHLIISLVLLQSDRFSRPKLTTALFAAGVLLFSGSIYLLALDEWMGISLSILGPITPLGGLLMIAGSLSLLLRKKE